MKPEIDILGWTQDVRRRVRARLPRLRRASSRKRLRELGGPWTGRMRSCSPRSSAGAVGARGYYLVQNYAQVRHELVASIFSGGGLVWYGGVIGGAIGVLAWMRWRGRSNSRMLDMCATALALGYGDRAHRLPGLRRRRLRHPLEPAVGDGLSARHRAHARRRARAAHPDLRDGRDGPARARAVAAARPRAPRRRVRAVPHRAPVSSASSSSSSGATRRCSPGSPRRSSRASC